MSRRRSRRLHEEDVEYTKEKPEKEESQTDIIFNENRKRKIHLGLIAAAFFMIGFFVNMQIGMTGYAVQGSQNGGLNVMTAQEAGNKAISFINDYLLQPGVSAKLNKIEEKNGVYEMSLEITSPQGSRDFTSYVTKDGKLLFVSSIDLDEKPEKPQTQNQQPAEVPKTDRPKVNVFVMSYCPFGLQFEKALIPVMKLLGSNADISVNFVDYIMHGKKELDENLRQYCIQKEQREKYVDYLECFVQSGDYSKCLSEAGVDEEKLDSCITATDEEYNITGLYNDRSTWSGGRFPQFPVESDMNSRYGVRGSPTFVVNGKVMRVNRSPEAVKEAICSAFVDPPEECEEKLSEATESPGIGPLGQQSASGSGGGCAQ
ncbi:MAG TPA: hypothetical protein ENG00_01285 [Candidatus Aenigmarchaeota archaeon]|nr:hypothetical protein [Candidatus Aenigmarchaeota archaeon]